MTNLEKQELRNYCKQGLGFEQIRKLVYCSDGTIKNYLKVFSPTNNKELNMTELTPAQKREQTMTAKYGPNWRQVIGKKASETYRDKYTPEQRSAIASKAGKIGGKNSPTKFQPGDPRAVRYGKLKKRAETRSE